MSYDPIPADGAGADLFDQPTLFYLTNRSIIDECYALRGNVAEALGEWFRTTVRDALVGPATDRSLEVSVARGPGSYHHVVLYPADATVVSGNPVIAPGVGWPAKAVDPSTNPPFVCIRRSNGQTGNRAARQFLDAGGRDVRGRLAAKGNEQRPRCASPANEGRGGSEACARCAGSQGYRGRRA